MSSDLMIFDSDPLLMKHLLVHQSVEISEQVVKVEELAVFKSAQILKRTLKMSWCL
jgi:hypothetical protein